MRKRYDEFGMEIKSSSKIPLILFILIISIILILFLFLTIRIRNNPKEQEQEETKKTETQNVPIMDENSSYNEEASLVVPTIANPTLYRTDTLNISLTDLTADKNGYILHIKATNTSNTKTYLFECNKIAIDGYETSATFKLMLSPYANETITTRITLEELNNLEIIDFNKLTFFLNISQNGEVETTTREVRMSQHITIDNTKKGLLKVDEKNKVVISYYKKIEDETDTYLYFEIENNSKKNQVIQIKKLVLNNKLYNIEDFKETTHFETKKIFYIKIPKKEIESITKLRISFFLFDPLENGKATYITNEKEFSI